MERIKKPGFRLAGLNLGRKTTNEGNQSAKDCGSLWQKFESRGIFDLIPGKLSDEIYAVYFDYEKDQTKPFSYFIGCKIDEDAAPPAGLDSLNIPAQNYVKIAAKGVMTGCIANAWKEIWNSGIPRHFQYDFEVYDERSKDWNDAEVDIFISTAV